MRMIPQQMPQSLWMFLRSLVYSNRKQFARIFVSLHFVYELRDKILRFGYWKQIIDDNSTTSLNGFWSMVFIVVLLAVGCACFLLLPMIRRRRNNNNRLLLVGLVCLATFQIPTSLLFEDSRYEQFDSASALGGVVACVLWEWEGEQEQQDRGNREFREEEAENDDEDDDNNDAITTLENDTEDQRSLVDHDYSLLASLDHTAGQRNEHQQRI